MPSADDGAPGNLLDLIRDETANPLDRAAALQQLQELRGWTQDELAVECGYSARQVRALLALPRLPDHLRDGLRASWLTPTHVQILTRLEKIADQIYWAQVVREKDLSSRELRRAIQKGRPAPHDPDAAIQPAPSTAPDSLASTAEPSRLTAPPPAPAPLPVSARDQQRVAALLVCHPHLARPVAEAMIRFLRENTGFAANVLDPIEDALAHIPPDLSDLTGSTCTVLLVLLDQLIQRLSTLRAAVQQQFSRTQ
ncbi:MAG: hypothetical protein KKA73_11660 [Chloroflexi bacterium]|nr:hypothetical protein [Chloroflexota bacterium]MBU1748335.1 hypothetical protein [Chloroflexota bacterium]